MSKYKIAKGGYNVIEEKVVVVTRSFQAGTGENGKTFDAKYFSEKVARPIAKLLKYKEVVETIIVVVNGEKGNRLAEIVDEKGNTPTMIALGQAFAKEIADKKIIVHLCKNWGNNPGSATALNEGLDIARQMSAKWLFNWSPEIELNGYIIENALRFARERNLSAVGVLRQRHWEKPQWKVPQNTACLWRINPLQDAGGFSAECNGTGRTILTSEYGEAPVAGMEDFHAILKMLRQDHELRWGMIGRDSPLKWDVDFPKGSERERNHQVKVARQYSVMKEWAKDIFPNLSFETVMDMVFARGHQD